MAQEQSQEIAWTFPEFETHERTRRWWTWFIIIDLAVFIYAIFSPNFLLALIVLMISGIIVFRHYHGPESVNCVISSEGIMVGERLYVWDEVKNFWLVYDPPKINNLYLAFKTALRPTMNIPLMRINPLRIREYLGSYIQEDLEKESQPTSEALGRLFKI